MNIVYLSIGSNMGDREAHLMDAIDKLNEHLKIVIEKQSSIYETEPVGYENQQDFLNMVIQLSTSLSAFELLIFTQKIELELGRKRDVRWGPRTVDLDILLFNNENIETEQLVVPHPRMLDRSFVLVPLYEINPNVLIPNCIKPIEAVIDQLPDKKGVRIWKQINGEGVSALSEN
jgi:2-amino-4-hydroxy-6-hydroxymethyldihydropteridine diphosphokinase